MLASPFTIPMKSSLEGMWLRVWVWVVGLLACSVLQGQEPVEPSLSERLAQQEEEIAQLREALAQKQTVGDPLEAMPEDEGAAVRLKKLEEEWEAFKKEQQKEAKKKEQAATIKIGGQIIVDSLWFSQDAASMAQVGDAEDALGFRRARLYASGEVFEVFNYAMGFDFAQGVATNGRPSFIDNYIGVSKLPIVGNLRIGHFFEPFTLERSSSNRNATFMERSLADAFAPSRNVGAMIFNQNEDQSIYWALGTFRGDSDNFGDDAGDQEGQAADGRLVYRPYYDEESGGRYYMHLGGAYSFRNASDGMLIYRSRPEAFGNSDAANQATPYFVSTGIMAAENSQLFGAEFLWVNGPLSIQSEYVMTTVDRTSKADVQFQGGYFNVSYFLTGEHRPYNRELAIMDRVMPFGNFFRVRGEDGSILTGTGAWELAARLSYIDLTNKDVQGGRLQDGTVGLNWYLSPFHRFKFNYILSHLDQGSSDSYANIFGIRFDTDF